MSGSGSCEHSQSHYTEVVAFFSYQQLNGVPEGVIISWWYYRLVFLTTNGVTAGMENQYFSMESREGEDSQDGTEHSEASCGLHSPLPALLHCAKASLTQLRLLAKALKNEVC